MKENELAAYFILFLVLRCVQICYQKVNLYTVWVLGKKRKELSALHFIHVLL